MFKKLLQSLSKSQAKPTPAPAASVSRPAAEPLKPTAPSAAPASAPKSAAKVAAPPQPAVAKQSPEQLCGITGKMTPDQIRSQLKLLYRRYNRSASSLDSKLRNEADAMLNAIVEVREKHFGQI